MDARQSLDPASPPVEAPQPTAADLRRAVLIRLRQHGPSTPDDLGQRPRLRPGRRSSTSSRRSRRPASSPARASATASVDRATATTSPPRPRASCPTNYDGLATGVIAAIEAVGGPDLIDRVFEARRTEARERVATRLAERLPADAPLVDRVRELAVIQDEQGYLCEATLGAGRDDPPGRIQLRHPPRRRRPSDGLCGRARAVPRRTRHRGRPRVAHHGWRALLLLPHRPVGRTGPHRRGRLTAFAEEARADGGRGSGLLALDDLAGCRDEDRRRHVGHVRHER